MLTSRNLFGFVFLCLAALSSAQNTSSPSPSPKTLPDSPSSTSTAQAKTGKDGKAATTDQSATSNDRLFYALPNFLTLEDRQHVPPMTVGQKFKAEVRSTFDPVNFFWYGFLAAIAQAQNSEPGYGQGWEAYGKRYGSAAGDGAIENFMVGAVFPSVLRQDPRFFQSSSGGFVHRLGYALEHMVVTRGDNGHNQFNYSEVFGSASAAAISTYSYHPSGDRNLSNAASVWGTQLSYDALTFGVKEFWPDIRRKLSKKKAPPQ